MGNPTTKAVRGEMGDFLLYKRTSSKRTKKIRKHCLSLKIKDPMHKKVIEAKKPQSDLVSPG